MQQQDESSLHQATMQRRQFLKSVGSAVGLSALLGHDALAQVEAAARKTIGLTPQQVAADESFWGTIQQAFTMQRGLTNLDNAWTCPSPRMVTEAMVRYTWHQEQVPAQQWVRDFEGQMDTIRTALARLYGAAPEEIAITRNATEALKTVLYGFKLNPGDEVLTTDGDYSSMLRTLSHREQRDRIKQVTIELPVPPTSMDQIVTAIKQAITPKPV